MARSQRQAGGWCAALLHMLPLPRNCTGFGPAGQHAARCWSEAAAALEMFILPCPKPLQALENFSHEYRALRR